MLPVSQDMLETVRCFISQTYSPLCSTNDMPFMANAVEVYPKSEGGYSVLLYKTQPPTGGDLDKVFEYNTDSASNKAYMDLCKGLEKYINSLDEYKYFKFQIIPGRRLTKQVVNLIIYPEHKFDKPAPEDLEKFDIKDLTRDSRLKQNESAVLAEPNRIKESTDQVEKVFLNESSDSKDEAWGKGYKAAKQDEYSPVRTRNPYEPGTDIYRYWQNGYRAGEEDLRNGYYNESVQNNLSIFESVLTECDGGACGGNGGCTCASDFAGQIPENMGAVTGPGKKDKKYSSVFEDYVSPLAD